MVRITIRSWATGDEQPVLARAIDDLLAAAVSTEHAEVCHEPATKLADLPAGAPGTLCIVSLAPFIGAPGAQWVGTEAIVRDLFRGLAEAGLIAFVLTVFRRVPDRASPEGRELLLQIRRLNLLATELSREFGAFVVDIDRVLANVGGLAVGGNFRLGSAASAQLAAEELALSLATNGLDDAVPFAAQEKIRSSIEARRVSPQLNTTLSPNDLVSLGGSSARRRQRVSIAIDSDQQGHVGWLARQVLNGRIGWRDALHRLVMAIRRRGLRESIRLLASACAQLIQRRRYSA